MTSWFGTLFTKFGKILVSGSTLEAYRHYKIHFGMEIFAVTPSRVCRQILKAQFVGQKMASPPFFGFPIQKWAKNRVFWSKFQFSGSICRKISIFPYKSQYPMNRSLKVLQLRGVWEKLLEQIFF